MNFKESIKDDINNTFFNIDEFSETHSIDGQNVNVIIDNDRLIHRSKKEYDGLSVGELLFFVKVGDLKKVPIQGYPLVFDNKQMIIFSVREDDGIYEIILTQNIGG